MLHDSPDGSVRVPRAIFSPGRSQRARLKRGLMPQTGLRFNAISVLLASIVTLSGLLLCIATPGVARADGVKFVARDHDDSFAAAAQAAEQSADSTAGRPRLDAAGLMIDDDSDAFQTPVMSTRALPVAVSLDSSPSRSSREHARANVASAFDANSHSDSSSDAINDSAAAQWAASFYGAGGFSFYGGAPVVAGPAGQNFAGGGSDRIDLGSAHSGDGDSNSSDGARKHHDGVAPRITWPARIFGDDPISAPEPSSLLMLGSGIFALAGLKRKYQSAK